MNKLFSILILGLILCLNTGCFEILEEIKMKNDGSGTATIKVDLSQSKDNIANYMSMDEVKGMKIPTKAEILSEVERVKSVVSKVEGISNVTTDVDLENFIMIVNGDFEKVEQLNVAINTAAETMNKTHFPTIKEDNFSFVGNTFQRHFNYKIPAGIFDKLGAMERYMLETAKMVSIFRFENSIKEYSNESARLAPSMQAIMLESSIAEIIKGNESLKNNIELQ